MQFSLLCQLTKLPNKRSQTHIVYSCTRSNTQLTLNWAKADGFSWYNRSPMFFSQCEKNPEVKCWIRNVNLVRICGFSCVLGFLVGFASCSCLPMGVAFQSCLITHSTHPGLITCKPGSNLQLLPLCLLSCHIVWPKLWLLWRFLEKINLFPEICSGFGFSVYLKHFAWIWAAQNSFTYLRKILQISVSFESLTCHLATLHHHRRLLWTVLNLCSSGKPSLVSNLETHLSPSFPVALTASSSLECIIHKSLCLELQNWLPFDTL